MLVQSLAQVLRYCLLFLLLASSDNFFFGLFGISLQQTETSDPASVLEPVQVVLMSLCEVFPATEKCMLRICFLLHTFMRARFGDIAYKISYHS